MAYLSLHHEHSSGSELSDTVVHTHIINILNTLQHGIQGDVRACTPHTSTKQIRKSVKSAPPLAQYTKSLF